MRLFDKLYNIAVIVLIVVIIVAAIGGIFAFLFFKNRKTRRKKEVTLDFSSFDRKDSKEYIKMIDDIKDDIIIADGWTRFIAVIECQGFDFYSAHVVEQSLTVQNYLGFINTIDKPISYRQFSKSVDLEHTINMYLQSYEKVLSKIDAVQNRLKGMQITLKKDSGMSESKQNLLYEEISKAKNELNALEFRKFHLEDQINYIQKYSGVATAPVITSTYVMDWVYNKDLTVDLTEDEIFERAKVELEAIVNAKIHALSAAGVKARRCNTNDLIDMCRRHSQPITAERYKMRDVLNSTYFDDITATDSINKINEEARLSLELEAISNINFASYASSDENNEKEMVFIKAGDKEE